MSNDHDIAKMASSWLLDFDALKVPNTSSWRTENQRKLRTVWSYMAETTGRTRAQQLWGDEAGAHCVPVSQDFLRLLPRLGAVNGQRGLNPTESMLIVQLLSLQKGDAPPTARMSELAARLDISDRQVRACCRRLESLGLVRRIQHVGGENSFDLGGLLADLAELSKQDAFAALASDAKATG